MKMQANFRAAILRGAVTAAVVGATAATAHAAGGAPAEAKADSVFHSPTAGFSITKPKGWRFATAEQVAANRAVARLKDKELEEQVRLHANAPLVAITKYEEPFDDLNPSTQVLLRPIGRLAGTSPVELMKIVVPPLQNAMADFAFVDSIQPAKVGGRAAAYTRAKYTIANPEGRTFPTLARLWVVPRGSFLFLISMSGPPEGDDVSEAEFRRMLDSIHIDD